MTVRYVSSTLGNNSYDGLSPTFTGGTTGPKLTLNGAEDTPVVAGDIIHVQPGVYRELLTVDVSGTAGNIIEYRGDYAGLIWPSTKGQVVRITGSDNDQTATRNNAISASSKNYRTFTGFQIGQSVQSVLNLTSCQYFLFDKCHIMDGSGVFNMINITGASQLQNNFSNCLIGPAGANARTTAISHTVTVDNSGHTFENCLFLGSTSSSGFGISDTRVGGVTVRNCTFFAILGGVRVEIALSVGQVVTVNNCIFSHCGTALSATTTAEFSENYNSFSGCITNRSNVNTGANSVSYFSLFDDRWFFQLLYAGAGPNSTAQVVSPFDLSSYSQLINVAGTSPTTTDMRGTAAITTREWGALEYDSTLKIQGGGGGAVSISPMESQL